MNKTPNALPVSMLQLGETMKCSFTLEGARRISHIEIRGGAYKGTNDKRKKGHYCVDIEVLKPNGEFTTIRSNTNLNFKQARSLHRQVTRKIAVFLWDNRNS